VGIELALPGRAGDAAHWQPRMEKALAAALRLRPLQLPAALCAVLWQTTILPRALYGCELRVASGTMLAPLVAAAKVAVCAKAPLELNAWNAPEVALGWPLGDAAPLHPMAYACLRQLHWLHLLANSSDIAGVVHRAVACPGTCWSEPSPALRSALAAVGWQIARNLTCSRSSPWPCLAPEPPLEADILLSPDHCADPSPDAVYTDGSITATGGGAAVWRPRDGESLLLHLPAARSSTHCELVALELALSLHPAQVLTDSLCALHLLRGWAQMPEARRLRCPDRAEVRRVLVASLTCVGRPSLEKVKAHDTQGVEQALPKAIGNDRADFLAKLAASGSTSPSLPASEESPLLGPAGDPVVLRDAGGVVILSVPASFLSAWWLRCRQSWASRGPRPRLDILYPLGMEFNWSASVGIFRRPLVQLGGFVHRVAPRVAKWIARVRCGCLATRERLARHGLGGVVSAECLCCGALPEDDAHVLAGCEATGAAPFLPALLEVWSSASRASKVPVPAPPPAWLVAHSLPLAAALLPATLLWHHPLPASNAARFCAALHLLLAERTAEVLRRRGEIMATASISSVSVPALLPGSSSSSSSLPALRRPSPLPPELRLSVAELRGLEVQQRSGPAPQPVMASRAPPCGSPRRRWLASRLVDMLREETNVCPASSGCRPQVLLDLFEETTGERYTTTPGSSALSRLTGFGKALANLVDSAVLDPPLQRRCITRSRWLYNRAPKRHRDADLWQRRAAREAAAAPVVPPAVSMEDVDAGLAAWLRFHPHLRATQPEQGLPSMGLLLLWEVDHGMRFPSRSGGSEAGLVEGFSRRLRRRVGQDDVLQGHMVPVDVVGALAPGLQDSHNLRWPVQLVPPAEGAPEAWFELFQQRWKDYLGTLRVSAAEGAHRQRARGIEDLQPAKRRRAAPPSRPATTSAPQPEAVPPQVRRPRPRSPSALEEGGAPRPKRQLSLAGWRQPPTPPAPHHGRAVEGPPT
jgi:hypothetical protein